jgi:surface protein
MWNVSAVYFAGGFTNMFTGVTLSTENYDSILQGWSNQSLVSNLVFSGGNSKYSNASLVARNTTLIGVYNWTITDGGPVLSCSVCSQNCSPCGGGCTATDLSSMYIGYDFVVDPSGIGNITGWNTSCITNMYRLFRDSNFNQDISGWDVSNVVSMYGMFDSSSFNKPLNSWNTSSVTDMSYMFRTRGSVVYDVVFNQPLDNWDTSKVIYMDLMFYSGKLPHINPFNQDVSMWNISQVTSMISMFTNTNLSTTNYDKLLIGWSNQSVQPGVSFGSSSTYTSAGLVGRNILTNATNAWSITDGGMYVCPENWVVSSTKCIAGQNYTKIYIDTNNCGTNASLPIDN